MIGASGDPLRPSHTVLRYLLDEGFDCVPVNPNEREVLGLPAFRTLDEAVRATGPFDMVDVGGLSAAQLQAIHRTACEVAFVDDSVRAGLRERFR